MKYAIVDIGSNTIRLCVYQTEGETFRKLFSVKETAGLASYVSEFHLTEEGIEKAVSILNKFQSILIQFSIEQTYVFATASLRNIDNSEFVLNRLFLETGYKIDLLSGEEESLCDFQGVMHNISQSDGLIFDVGGGSTEIVFFRDNMPDYYNSIGIGSLNMYNKYVKKILPKSHETEMITERVKSELSNVFSGKKFSDFKKKGEIIGVGGTARALLRLINQYYNLDEKNRIITLKQLNHVYDISLNSKNEMSRIILKICPDRVHTIIPGMLIIRGILKKSGSKEIIISKYGVREGYLVRHILQKNKRKGF